MLQSDEKSLEDVSCAAHPLLAQIWAPIFGRRRAFSLIFMVCTFGSVSGLCVSQWDLLSIVVSLLVLELDWFALFWPLSLAVFSSLSGHGFFQRYTGTIMRFSTNLVHSW